jgi:hypothetical protein
MHNALRLALSDTVDDDRINLAIDAASRAIENYTQRRFWQDPSATARVFTAMTYSVVEVDDFQTTTGLIVETDPYGDGSFPITWDSTDYQLEPLNAQLDGQPWAFDRIRAIRSKIFPIYGAALASFPQARTQAQIRVTARWGWANIPTDVIKACIAEAVYLFKSDDVPLGATGMGQTGVLKLAGNELGSPVAKALLGPYTSQGVLVG